MAERILLNEFKALSQEKWLIDDSITDWSIALMVINPASLYYGGYFKATMTFPSNYPYSPPTFQFTRPLYHPNIYSDGKLCISILHPPGDDEQSGEKAAERWSPVQRVESVLLSIVSLLDDAECSSPANVDAGVLLRGDYEGYKKRVKEDVEKSLEDVPKGFVMPTHESTVKRPKEEVAEHDADFWNDSGESDRGFGGSDTDEEFEMEEDDEEGEEQEEMEDDEDGGIE
ncbi:uncharacterized protein KY384_003712 [Bacidia gigantensis]|uniref:uncharacterized protein n=1 Tax=Bacidia gigantensis TaxID=2732470 RepID=UPI001D04E040|nr:uncharacterized protein KY384_003712 [Bacidia gigantensis]KAG8532075.1 hypothetical protein KY384_003712 [Bacidia gigantensis]